MTATLSAFLQAVTALPLVRARAKVLAREDRRMRAQLVRVRREHHLTQRAVADVMGVTQQAVQKLERYDSDPKLSTLRRYANAVGAVVEHRVTADVGQSIALSQRDPWTTFGTMSGTAVAQVPASSQTNYGWSESKRTDFALSA